MSAWLVFHFPCRALSVILIEIVDLRFQVADLKFPSSADGGEAGMRTDAIIMIPIPLFRFVDFLWTG